MKTPFVRFAFLALVSLQSAFAAVADENLEATLDFDESAQTRPIAAVELGYFAPDFPRYPGAVSGRRGNGIRFAGEWLPYAGQLGKLGLGLSLGYGKIGATASTPFLEVVPLEGLITYRADLVENQFIVPFVHTGLQVTYLHEQFVPGTQRFNGVEYGGGIALCLDFLDRLSASLLDRSTGIHNTYAVLDFRHVGYLGAVRGPNLSRDELRFSLRFEF